MDRKQSSFTQVSELDDSDFLPAFGSGTNKKISKSDFVAQLKDEAQVFIYPTVSQLQSANLAADPDWPIYARVEETEYRLYKITSLVAGANDIPLDNGATATFQEEYSEIGFVVGPSLSVDGAVALFDGESGTQLKNGPVMGVIGKNIASLDSADDTSFVKINPDESVSLRNTAQFRSDLSISNVDNTSDEDKPISDATQNALDGKVTGPSSSVADQVALFDGITGKFIKAGQSITQYFNTFLVDLYNVFPRTINTFADLETTSAVDGQVVYLKEYYIEGKSGGGKFIGRSGVITADGGMTSASATAGVYWERTEVYEITAEMYGVKFDGFSDDTPRINASIAACAARNLGTVSFNTKGTCLLSTLTFFDGVAAGFTIYRNEWNLIIAKDNVTLRATAPVTLKAANGLVASNKDEGGTKGYSIIGSGIRKVTNFAIVGDFTFDGNGDNNLVFPPNWSGAQAHAPAYSFYLGIDDFLCEDAKFINFPGANVGIIEWPSSNIVLRNLYAYRLSDTIPGNTEVVDHSTFYTRANGYLIDNCKVEQPVESTVSTPFECHFSGVVRDCTAINTGVAALAASFFDGFAGVIRFERHKALNVRSGVHTDFGDDAQMKVFITNPFITLRAAKREVHGAIIKVAHGIASVDPGTSYVQDCEVHITSEGGYYEQLTPVDWDDSDRDLNAFFRGGRFKSITVKGVKAVGFKGAIGQIEACVPNATIDFTGNEFINCGYSQSPLVNYRAFKFTNSGLTDYVGYPVDLRLSKTDMVNCLYATLIGTTVSAGGFLVAPTTVTIDRLTMNTNIMPHEGGAPLVEWDWFFDYTIVDSNTNNANSPSLAAPIHGQIVLDAPSSLSGQRMQMRKLKNAPNWYKVVDKYDAAPPATPLPYGDKVGDKYINLATGAGSPLFYVCKVSGVNVSTLGTWVGVGTIP